MKKLSALLLAVVLGLSAVLSGCIQVADPSGRQESSRQAEVSKEESKENSKEESKQESQAVSKPEESSVAPVESKPEESAPTPVESKPEESVPTPVESSPEESSEPVSVVDEEMAAEFDQYVHDSFVETIEGDYTAYHIYFRHPENYGLDINNVEVGYGWRPTEEALAESHEGLDEMLAEFNAFDREKLRDDQKLIYDIMRWQVDFNIESSDPRFDYYGSYFESASGIHFQLATLFSDWKLHNEAEVEELILLLADTKPYIDTLLDYTRKQEEMGLLMIDLDDVIEHCEGILESGMDSSVLTSMYAAIEGVGLSEELTARYKDEVKTEFENSFLPAYQDIYDAMVQFKENGLNNELGLASLPDGKEYYNLLIKHETGLDITADGLWDMLEEASTNTMATISKYARVYPAAMTEFYYSEEPSTGFENYREILDYIFEKMQNDFPDVGTIEYNIVDLEEEVASDSGIAAYFNTPAIDSDEMREMRVNPHNSGISTLDVFKTVAHEGFPGHMYQFAYAYQNLNDPYLMTCTNFSGYTEGYAVYAGYEAFNYLDGYTKGYLDIYNIFDIYTYYVITQADIGIHYKGWDVDEFLEFLTGKGFNMTREGAEGQYKQLWANPCIFMPYYVGYLKISNLKSMAKQELGSKFSNMDFNEALLKSGAAPFSVVEQNINDYIESAR